MKQSKYRIWTFQRKIIKQKRRRKEYEKKRNIARNSKHYTIVHRSAPPGKLKLAVAAVPESFSFENNLEGLIAFNNQTYKKYKEFRFGHLFFDMSKVIDIDMTAICLLLSLLNKLTWKQISYAGNAPDDSVANEIFIKSGFLEMMKTRGFKLKPPKIPNQLYMIGQNDLKPQVIGESIKKAMQVVVGEYTHFKPLYSIMIEICTNSVEHANEPVNEKNWLVSISYEEGRANFVLVDSGQGILKTLHRKAAELFSDILTFKSESAVLKGLFEKKYQSRTREVNRHKGMPRVRQAYLDGIITGLEVLTNKVYYKFDQDEAITLYNEYRGTLFKWSIDSNNYKQWKRKQSL